MGKIPIITIHVTVWAEKTSNVFVHCLDLDKVHGFQSGILDILYLFVLRSLKQKSCGVRSFAEAWTSNIVDWKFFFRFYLWDQSHITKVWNTRETGDIKVSDMNTLVDSL